MKTNIILGDEVQDIYTGYKGVVLSVTEFVNGCIQYGVAKKFEKKDPIEAAGLEVNIDSQSLKLIKKGLRHREKDRELQLIIEAKKNLVIPSSKIKKRRTGGPVSISRRRM